MLKEIQIKAYNFAKEKHEGQKRRFSGLDYFTHVKFVARIVEQLTNNSDLVAAALLHDVIEDTKTPFSELYEHFGSIIAFLVHELTTDLKDEIFMRDKGLYLAEKMIDMTPGALIIKLADRYHNISFLDDEKVSREFREKYIKETEKILLLLIDKRKSFTDVHKKLIDMIQVQIMFIKTKYNL